MPTLLRAPSSTAPVKLGTDRVDLILAQLDKLPAPSPVAAKLLAVSASEDASLAAIVQILRTDAALSAGVLRLANRADLGARAPRMDVHKAVTLLGLNRVRNAVIAQQFFRILDASPGSTAAEQCKQLWKHSLAVACACEVFVEMARKSPRVQRITAGELFVCGLLHDVGKLALAVSLPKSYARVMHRCGREQCAACDVEQDVLGVDHTIAGKRLASRWGLPVSVVECVWLHHQGVGMLPASARHSDAIHVVQLADAAMSRAGFASSSGNSASELESACRVLDFNISQVDALVQSAVRRLKTLCELVEIDVDLDPAEQIARLTEANRELGRLNSELMSKAHSQSSRLRCLHAIETFVGAECQCVTPGDVCIAAVRAADAITNQNSDSGSQHAVAFIHPKEGEHIFVANARGCEIVRASEYVLDQGQRMATSPGTERLFNGARRGDFITPAPEWTRELRRAVTDAAMNDDAWLLSFSVTNLDGGVIFDAPPDLIAELNSAWYDLQTLCRVIAAAASAAFEHAEAQRMADEALDINRRLHAAQKDLLRVRSLDMIAQMAAGAAHEVNNPLSVISGRAQMMRAKAPDEDAIHGLDVIIDQSRRASGIVTELMRFAKPDPPEPSQIALRQEVESICQRWENGVGQRSSAISVSAFDPGIAIFADPVHLREILEAILTNAVDASDDKPDIKINSPSRSSDDTVRITVTDRGRGMTLETLEHALDPFYSNRPAGRSRGLGLSRAYRLVEINGGRLWIESKVGIGTTVNFELPARAPDAPPPR